MVLRPELRVSVDVGCCVIVIVGNGEFVISGVGVRMGVTVTVPVEVGVGVSGGT